MPSFPDFGNSFANAFNIKSAASTTGPPKNVCEPSRIFGPVQQTLFLGCSVMSFTVSLGWNEQVSELTVQLVRDLCVAPSNRPKVYWDTRLVKRGWTAADPGFMGETLDIIGAPVYFRVGDFEFAGIVQSWNKQSSQSGDPTYVVKISDPREILNGTQVILNNYSGPIFHFQQDIQQLHNSIYNVINPFGFLERFGGGVFCPPHFQFTGPPSFVGGEYFPVSTPINPHNLSMGPDGVVFGTYGGFWGGARVNDNGIQWDRLRLAINVLINTTPFGFIADNAEISQWSPYGRIMYRGLRRSELTGLFTHGFGILIADTTNAVSGVTLSHYLVDLSEIDNVSTYFRLQGTSASLLDIISTVTQETGQDYYIELIPIIDPFHTVSNGILKIIKVRTVSRLTAPSLGKIQGFIDRVENTGFSPSYSIGRELRNEPVASFILGGNKQIVYQAYANEDPDRSGTNVISQGGAFVFDPNCEEIDNTILPYFGRHSNGDIIRWCNTSVEAPTLDINAQLLILNLPFPFVNIDLIELLSALDGYDFWSFYINTIGTDTSTAWPSLLKPVLQEAPANADDFIELMQQFGLVPRDLPHPGNAHILHHELSEQIVTDLQSIFAWVENFASSYLGKKFAVRLPFVCGYSDSFESQKVILDVEPTDSGWTEMPQVLGLINGVADLEFFSSPDGKVQPFVYMGDATNKDYAHINKEDYLVSFDAQGNQGLYLRVDVEDEFVYYDDGTKFGPRAIITLPDVIYDFFIEGDLGTFPARNAIVRHVKTRLEDKAGLNPTEAQEQAVNIVGSLVHKVGANKRTIFEQSPAFIAEPFAAAIPLKSNANTYGPWSNPGPPGQVLVEQQEGLVPWEYGSVTALNTAGKSLADAAVTNMQVGEMGSVEVAGYPIIPIGAEIGALEGGMFGPNGVHLVENRTFSTNASFGFQTVSFNYPISWTGLHGPAITSINVSVGQNGFTTRYDLRTFTPKFGLLAKRNAEAIKSIGNFRQQLNKFIKRVRFGQSQFIKTQRSKKAKQNVLAEGWGFKFNSAHEVFVGELHEWRDTYKRTIISNDPVEDLALHMSQGTPYDHKAIMSFDGLIRPISMDGDGNFPRYAEPLAAVPQLITSRGAQSPVAKGDGAGNFTEAGSYYYEGISNKETIDLDNLNPLTNPKGMSRSVVVTNKSSDTDIGHDIDILARGVGTDPPRSAILPIEGLGEDALADYRADYRAFALRGPLLVQQWGYDTDGKPVPNAADSESEAEIGNFTSSSLQDNFLAGWLRKPKTWPVAPVDLRYDRDRGLWVAPAPYRLLHVTLESPLNAGGTARASVDTDVEPASYDNDGNAISSPMITLTDHNIHTNGLSQGTKVIASYNQYLNEYHVVEVVEASGGGGGSGLVVSDETCEEGSGAVQNLSVDKITFGSGLRILDQGGRNVKVYSNLAAIDTSSCWGPFDPNIVTASDFSPFEVIALGRGLLGRYLTNDCRLEITPALVATNPSNCITTALPIAGTFNSLEFGKGLYGDQLDDCTLSLGSAITGIQDDDLCVNTRVFYPSKLFNEITFGRGIYFNQTADDCKLQLGAGITGLTDNTCVTGTFAEGHMFNGIIFGKGIGVSDKGCGAIRLGAGLSISDVPTCVNTSDTKEHLYSSLVLGKGLYSRTDNDCELTLGAASIYQSAYIANDVTFSNCFGVTQPTDCSVLVDFAFPASNGSGYVQDFVTHVYCSGNQVFYNTKTITVSECGTVTDIS